MTDDDRIRSYLHEVRSFLHLPSAQRSRALDELEAGHDFLYVEPTTVGEIREEVSGFGL